MFSAIDKEVIADLISEATHSVLDDDEIDMALDVWEGKNDKDEEDY